MPGSDKKKSVTKVTVRLRDLDLSCYGQKTMSDYASYTINSIVFYKVYDIIKKANLECKFYKNNKSVKNTTSNKVKCFVLAIASSGCMIFYLNARLAPLFTSVYLLSLCSVSPLRNHNFLSQHSGALQMQCAGVEAKKNPEPRF